MPELHQGYAQFYKFFWGKHEKPDGELFSETQRNKVDTSKDFSKADSGRGFWETVIVETLPEIVVNEKYNRANFWWPPYHPRSTHKENSLHFARNSKSYMDVQGYGVINRSEIPDNTMSDFRGEWGDDDPYDPGFKLHAPTYYLALPIRKGGFQLGDHLWLDTVKPIRAVYFPVFFEESETLCRYGVYVKLDLLHLEKNHIIGPDVSCPKDWRKLGQASAYEIGKEGVNSWKHTLVIDVIKYISLATVPYGQRKVEPMTAVKYTDPNAIQTREVDWHFSWYYVSVSWETVHSFETGKKIKEEHPPPENYIARGISVFSLIGGFIPIIGPVLTKGLGVVEKQLETGKRPDYWELIGIPRKAWDGIDDRPQKDLVKKLELFVDFLHKEVISK
ncbi:hypothetical protein N7495_001104 [Penicillium taxi]|uniref:uncharacterized protein n=1 Tax=Penicillium taxi TaxID=168475 RepID=UPI0025453241|nr:uncharacterized protein N7495_001104 [Penicillium taxi]KAJ5908422.1 hypothetical protein N7495_001104 [Penicillium taxi]